MLRLLPLPALLLLVVSQSASAQTLRLSAPALADRPLTLPPTSIATIDEATALALNPAALTHVGSLQLHYLHERNAAEGFTGNGVYLADTFFGALGVGASMEWLSSSSAASEVAVRRTTFGLSLGGRALSVGASYSAFASDLSDIERMGTVNLGLSARPSRYFAWGLTIDNLGEVASRLNPEVVLAQRTLTAGIGLRPFGERFTLAADYRAPWSELGRGTAGYTLRARVVEGLSVGGGFSHRVGPGPDALAAQVSLTLDSPNLGLTYSPGGWSGGGLDQIAAVRLSSQRYPALSIRREEVAMFDLDDLLAGSSGGALALLGIGGPGADPFISLMQLFEKAKRDPNLKAVVLKVNNLPGIGMGRAEELRQQLLALRAEGKRVLAVVLSADDPTYLAISAAERIYVLPQAMLEVNGLAASVTTLGSAMNKLGVKWDVARVGEYKTAPEALTLEQMSPAQRETTEALLKNQSAHLEQTLATARNIPVEKVREAFARGLIPPRQAVELGLADAVMDSTSLDKEIATVLPGLRFNARYRPGAERDDRWGTRTRIAVVPVIGNISGGKSREDPLGAAQIAGAETVIRAVERAVADPSVRGIIIRVDSGGGDGLASDLMYRAIREAAKRKPVVASMGDAAASGGYYAAMGANEIVAAPTTVTGSIGVFVLKPAIEGLGNKLGIHRETIKSAPLANLLSLWEPWSPEAQKAAQNWVDSFYADFIQEVATSRKMTVEAVDKVARGRVWSGVAAKELGLVDTLGGFGTAFASVRARAGISEREEVSLEIFGEPRGLLVSPGGEPGVAEALLGTPAPRPDALLQLAREVGLDSEVLLTPGLKAMLPFRIDVR